MNRLRAVFVGRGRMPVRPTEIMTRRSIIIDGTIWGCVFARWTIVPILVLGQSFRKPSSFVGSRDGCGKHSRQSRHHKLRQTVAPCALMTSAPPLIAAQSAEQ